MMDESDLKGLSDLVGTLTPPTPTQVADARTYIASRAHDATDLRELLAAVGIGAAS